MSDSEFIEVVNKRGKKTQSPPKKTSDVNTNRTLRNVPAKSATSAPRSFAPKSSQQPYKLHPRPTTERARRPSMRVSSNTNTGSKEINSARNRTQPPQLCTFFEEHGYCKFGDACYYVHRKEREALPDPRNFRNFRSDFRENSQKSNPRYNPQESKPAPVKREEKSFKDDDFPDLTLNRKVGRQTGQPAERTVQEPIQWPSEPSLPPMEIKHNNSPVKSDFVSENDDDDSMDYSIAPEEFLASLQVQRDWYDDSVVGEEEDELVQE